MPARLAACAEINAAIAERLAPLRRDEAVAWLLSHDIPAAPVLTAAEADASAHYAARGLAVETCAGRLTPFPVRMAGMEAAPREAPELGERNR